MSSDDPPGGSLVPDHRYRPEIDGLRAVAVLLVVLYHAKLGVPGGYIGVDVFFVISGFLIGSLIWRDVQAGRFSMVHFWERRARRIIPALVVMVACTLIAGWFVMMPLDYEDLGRSGAAQALFTANHYFRGRTGYFIRIMDPEPLLHTWSLAVEEQYYLVAPLALVALWWVPRIRRRALLALCLALIAGSLALSIRAVADGKPWPFYYLTTRLWELLMGGTLALFPVALFGDRRRLRQIAAFVGLVLIVAPAFLYDKKTPFPGLAAIPPCLGALLIIAANGASITIVGAALSLRPIVFVGLISYSFYLLHWPLLALVEYRVGRLPSLALRLALVMVAMVLAAASWRWVETPVRQRRWLGSRRAIFVFTLVALAGVFFASRAIIGTGGFPRRFPPAVAQLQAAVHDHRYRDDVSARDVRAGRLIPLGNPAAGERIDFLVWGDSHALSMAPAFDALCRERGIRGEAAAMAATVPLLNYVDPKQTAAVSEAVRLHREAVLAHIQKTRVRHVVLIANWGFYLPTYYAESPLMEAAVFETVERIVAAGAKPWIILQVPVPQFHVPRALARAVAFGDPLPVRGSTPFNGIVGSGTALLDRLRAVGVSIIDPRPPFLAPSGDSYMIVDDGIVLYIDNNHLTTQAALRKVLPALREHFTVGLDPAR